MTMNMLFAGFGGQGVLFAGKQLAKTAMYSDMQVSWLPSYGPEMRGGAANCSVIISNEEIGSPLVVNPDLLVAMNIPSYEKFEPNIAGGGTVIYDSTLVPSPSETPGINHYPIPATGIASENNLEGFSNVIILGYLLKLTKLFEYDKFLDLMIKGIPASKSALIEKNKTALELGYNYNK